MSIQSLDYCNKAIELKESIESSFLDLAEYLYNIKEKQLYEPQWSSFTEFAFELKMSANMINKLIQIHRTFILGYGFTQNQVLTAGGWGALQEILPHVSSRQSAEKWLNTASVLNKSDLRKEIMEVKTGISMKNCTHEHFYRIQICEDCGERIRIYE